MFSADECGQPRRRTRKIQSITDRWKWLRQRRGDGETGAPRWTTATAPHYGTLNPPVYCGNGTHSERREWAWLQAAETDVYGTEIIGISG